MNIIGGLTLIAFGIIVMIFGDRRLFGKTVSYYSWEPWHDYGKYFLGGFFIIFGMMTILNLDFPFK